MGRMVDRQCAFAKAIAEHILWLMEQGYQVSLGDALRAPDCSYGHPDSFHKLKLAIDLNLFRNGKYLTTKEEHFISGRKWEERGGTWGGRFDLDGDGKDGDDANHYSWGETSRSNNVQT